jgi:hypothetical protein
LEVRHAHEDFVVGKAGGNKLARRKRERAKSFCVMMWRFGDEQARR